MKVPSFPHLNLKMRRRFSEVKEKSSESDALWRNRARPYLANSESEHHELQLAAASQQPSSSTPQASHVRHFSLITHRFHSAYFPS